MILNSVQFPDGSRVETFSQTQRQMLVNQNVAPLPGNQVTGTTGNPFMQLSTNSLIIQTNDFLQGAGKKPKSAPWTSDNALFSIWIGINDVGNSYQRGGDRNA